MSSGTDMSREERQELRQERLQEALRELKPVATEWVKQRSECADPPTKAEWLLWRHLNRVLGLLP